MENKDSFMQTGEHLIFMLSVKIEKLFPASWNLLKISGFQLASWKKYLMRNKTLRNDASSKKFSSRSTMYVSSQIGKDFTSSFW